MICQHCGRELDDNAKFCDYCGSMVQTQTDRKKIELHLDASDTKNDNAAIENRKKKAYNILLIIFVTAFIVCVGVLVNSVKNYNFFTNDYKSADILKNEIDKQADIIVSRYTDYRNIIYNIRTKLCISSDYTMIDTKTVDEDINLYPEKTNDLIESIKEMETISGIDYSDYYNGVDIDVNFEHFKDMKSSAEEYVEKMESLSLKVKDFESRTRYDIEKDDRAIELSLDDIYYDYFSQFKGIEMEDFCKDQQMKIDNDMDKIGQNKLYIRLSGIFLVVFSVFIIVLVLRKIKTLRS